ncbi:MAG: alpha/beta fold hydrolase [Bryobacteraceae bacterium]
MMKPMFWAAALVMLIGSPLCAQDIAGDWQGTLKAGKDLRIVVAITKGENGGWNAMLYSIDQGPDGTRASSITLQGATLKLTIDSSPRGAYEGTLSPDGASIKGTWTQGAPLPLDFKRATKETAWQRDSSPHTVQFIAVDKDVKLEVLDWGGSGRPVVLLAGLGNTAHVFDDFAPKLTGAYHVYGITRRGFGESSAPAPVSANYTADRLSDDVLAVAGALKLNRPVLAGHSIAGEELSSVGSRHPEKVAGLIYLDAGYSYAFYDRSRGDLLIDSLELQKQLEQLQPGKGPANPKQLVDELLETSLPQIERDLKERKKDLEAAPEAQMPPQPAVPTPAQAIMAGQQKYTEIRVPVLAIYALPHETPPPLKNNPTAAAAMEARDLAITGAQAKAFESGVPSARVVRLAHANHFVMRSNEADVLREMNAFLASLH